jgi:hypothetical protein
MVFCTKLISTREDGVSAPPLSFIQLQHKTEISRTTHSPSPQKKDQFRLKSEASERK